MPLYEYLCDACGVHFEVMQKFADQPLTVHETCGGAVHRLLSAPALQFKGSGWYVNDYAKVSKAGSSGSSSKTDTSSKSESKASPSSSDSSSSPAPSSSTPSSDTK